MSDYSAIQKITQHRGVGHVTFVVDALAVDYAKLGGGRDDVVRDFAAAAERRGGASFFVGDTLHVYEHGGRA